MTFASLMALSLGLREVKQPRSLLASEMTARGNACASGDQLEATLNQLRNCHRVLNNCKNYAPVMSCDESDNKSDVFSSTGVWIHTTKASLSMQLRVA